MATTSTTTRAKKTQAPKETVTEEVKQVDEPIVPKDIDPNQYVTVRNGFQGTLVYESPRTHEIFLWEGFGTEQEMELRELKNAKNSKKKFFINNWFMFDESWIIDYLGVGQYYKHAISIDDFDNIFTMSPAQIKKVVSEMSAGQKKSVIYRAAQLIKEGEIDSRKVINALEEALGVELIEK